MSESKQFKRSVFFISDGTAITAETLAYGMDKDTEQHKIMVFDLGGGTLIILLTSKPAIFPASFVACLWLSVKYAGKIAGLDVLIIIL